VLAELIAGSDVLVENFRPGVRARIGFDEKRLKALNRDLVCCHITGFGANLNNAMISMLGFLAANCLATGEQPGAQRQRPCDRLALWHVPHRRRRGGDRALQRSGLL